MNNIDNYKNDIDDVLAKIENNINYFESFGDAYIPLTIKEHLETIVDELNKVKEIVHEKEDNSVHLEPSI